MRYIKLILLALFSLVINCKPKVNYKDLSTIVEKQNHTLITKDSVKEKIEYLSGNLLINNRYSFEGKAQDLKLLIKKPDTIKQQEDECGYILEEEHLVWYYLNCEIEVSKTNYVFRTIDFNISSFTVKYNNIIFSKNYTLQSFKEDFSISFTRNKNEEREEVTIFVPTHPQADDLYIFTFKNNKLTEIRYFFPC